MLKSMTGYGRGDVILFGRRFNVEIKSVNHRYNDIAIKLPRIMNSFEEKAKKIVGQRVQRGKTDVYIHMESLSPDDVSIKTNFILTDAYMSQLKLIKERYGLKDEPNLSLITRFPDVITVDRAVEDEKILNEIEEGMTAALTAALDGFIEMRTREGGAICDDIKKKCHDIETLIEKVETRAPAVSAEYETRLRAKVERALENVNIDENRLMLEITLFSDKSCIDEELTRLRSHVEQMGHILAETESVGRKLDFLVQEMNREVNTIGSKSNDLELTRLTVDLKSEIEKIREQVQNIE